MTEIKTNETINVFPCTYILISRAIRPLDHETITKICQCAILLFSNVRF